MLAQERHFLNGHERINDLVDRIRRAVDSEPIHDVERDIWDTLLAMGKDLLTAFVLSHGDGDLGETIENEEGELLRRMEDQQAIRYVSIFGEILSSGWVYAKRESQKLEVQPLRAKLQLPESDFSILLEDWDQELCVDKAYEKAGSTIKKILGLNLGVRAQEQMNRRMSEAVEELQDTIEPPAPSDEGEILVVAADCGGVPLTKKEAARVGLDWNDESEGSDGRRGKTKQCAAGAVYSVDRFVRTADDILDEALRKECSDGRPKPQHKRVRAFMPDVTVTGAQTRSAKDKLFEWAAHETLQRLHVPTVMVALMDGERALWSGLRGRFPEEGVDLVEILDFWHLLGYVRDAAKGFHPDESDKDAREQLVERLLRMILDGRAAWAMGSLKQMRTKHNLRGKRAETVNAAIRYMSNNLERMRYDEYLAAGYPIGSGVAEGTIRNLSRDRLCRTGMRWTIEGAQAMLNVRAAALNAEWDALFEHRAAQIDNAHREARNLIRQLQMRRVA